MSYEKAMELFGSKARIAQRQARRMVQNEQASKIMKVYLSQYKEKLVPVLSKVVDDIYSKATTHFTDLGLAMPEKPNAARLLDDLVDRGYLGSNEYLFSVSWEDFKLYVDAWNDEIEMDEQEAWDKVIDRCNAFEKVIEDAEKRLNNVVPIFDLWSEPIDDSYSIAIGFRKTAVDFFLKQFKGFDSFMAVESTLTEDAKDAAKLLASLGIGAGLTLGCAYCKMYVRAALAIGGTALAVGCYASNITNRHQQLSDWKNPTPEEKASIEVFKQKYEPAMMREAEVLSRLMMEEFGNVVSENGYSLRAASPTMLFTDHIYSHFFVASAKIPANHKQPNRTAAATWQPKLDAFKAELDKKYGGILSCSYIVTANKEIVFGITFEWVGYGGIILPNLR